MTRIFLFFCILTLFFCEEEETSKEKRKNALSQYFVLVVLENYRSPQPCPGANKTITDVDYGNSYSKSFQIDSSGTSPSAYYQLKNQSSIRLNMILANGNPACKVSVAADLCTLDGYVQEGYGCNNSQYASYFSAGALTCDFNFKNSGKIVVSFDAAKSDSKSATPICNLDFTVSKP